MVLVFNPRDFFVEIFASNTALPTISIDAGRSPLQCLARRPCITQSVTGDSVLLRAYVFSFLRRLVGLVVMASTSGAEDPGFEFRLRRDFFLGSSHTSDLAPQWLPCQAPGIIGSALGLVCPVSALGLVCPVSVYSDWER